jgi:hypothetical protein
MKNPIQVIKYRGGNENVYRIEANGKHVGLISKFAAQRGYTHPWKAFGPVVNGQNEMLGVFYGKEGRKAAIAAVVAGAKPEPVIPECEQAEVAYLANEENFEDCLSLAFNALAMAQLGMPATAA